MSATKTYDPGKHYLSFAGIPITGFAEGTYINAERQAEQFTDYAGAGGDVARVRNRDQRGTVKVTLMATSATNDALSSIADSDEETGAGIGELQLTDGNGTTVCGGPNAWIKKRPALEMSKEMPTREWEFTVAKMKHFVGGNNV